MSHLMRIYEAFGAFHGFFGMAKIDTGYAIIPFLLHVYGILCRIAVFPGKGVGTPGSYFSCAGLWPSRGFGGEEGKESRV